MEGSLRRRSSIWLASLLLFTLALPLAAADAGTFESAALPAFESPTWHVMEGVVALRSETTLWLDAGRIRGEVVARDVVLAPGVDNVATPSQPEVRERSPESVEASDVVQARLVCGPHCWAFVEPTVGSQLSVVGAVAGTIDDEGAEYWGYSGGTNQPAGPHDYRLSVPVNAIALEATTLTAAGAFNLYLVDAALVVTALDGTERAIVEARHEGYDEPAGPAVHRIAMLEIEAGRADIATPAAVHVIAARVASDGFRLDHAQGKIERDDGAVGLRDEAIVVTGKPELDIVRATADALLPQEPRFSYALGGDATVVSHAAAATGVAIATTVTVATTALALLLVALRFLPFLYTRLPPAKLLENTNRRRLHEAIAETSGIHAERLANDLGLARAVVQHHLGHLRRGGLVRAERVGRATGYVIANLSPHASVPLLQAMLQPKRSEIARALITHPEAMSQADIAEAVGVPLRTASYHLAKLEREGLVRATGGQPRRYEADARLRELL